jgi:putative spermidine/putrescine transport system permease protein
MMAFQPSRSTIVLAGLVLVLLILPSLIAIPASLTDRSYLSLPDAIPSLHHYYRFFTEPGWRDGFVLSFVTAAAATSLAVPVGTAFAVGAWSAGGLFTRAAQALALLPIVIPGIVSAIAIFRQWTILGLYDTIPGVVLVQAIVATPLVVITVTAALAEFDRRLVRAAQSMGAGAMRTVWRVIVPGVRPGILSGAALAFVAGWDESVITLFVTGGHVRVLPRLMWDGLRYDIDPIVAVVATLMLGFTAVGVVIALTVGRIGMERQPTARDSVP